MSQNDEDILQNAQIIPHDEHKGWKDGWEFPPPAVGRRMLSFPDDTQIGVVGLDEIMAELYSKARKATDETAEEIINRLELKRNFIPSSERARKEYSYVLLKEYRKYIKDRSESGL